jgi:hypothetical protein
MEYGLFDFAHFDTMRNILARTIVRPSLLNDWKSRAHSTTILGSDKLKLGQSNAGELAEVGPHQFRMAKQEGRAKKSDAGALTAIGVLLPKIHTLTNHNKDFHGKRFRGSGAIHTFRVHLRDCLGIKFHWSEI